MPPLSISNAAWLVPAYNPEYRTTMETFFSFMFNIMPGLMATAADAQPMEKLPPPTRAAVIMALLGLVILGLFIVVAILLGGHWVRRLGKHRRGPIVPPDVAPLHPYRSTSAKKAAQQKLECRDNVDGDTLATGETIVE